MTRKLFTLGLVGLTITIISFAVVFPASAKPIYSSACARCHTADSAVSISVSMLSSNSNSTTYSYSVTGPYSGASGFGVFDPIGTKIDGDYGASGTFAVANGQTYTVYGVNKDPGSMLGVTSTTISPVATTTPTPTPTPVIVPTATPGPSPTPDTSSTTQASDKDADDENEADDDDNISVIGKLIRVLHPQPTIGINNKERDDDEEKSQDAKDRRHGHAKRGNAKAHDGEKHKPKKASREDDD